MSTIAMQLAPPRSEVVARTAFGAACALAGSAAHRRSRADRVHAAVHAGAHHGADARRVAGGGGLRAGARRGDGRPVPRLGRRRPARARARGRRIASIAARGAAPRLGRPAATSGGSSSAAAILGGLAPPRLGPLDPVVHLGDAAGLDRDLRPRSAVAHGRARRAPAAGARVRAVSVRGRRHPEAARGSRVAARRPGRRCGDSDPAGRTESWPNPGTTSRRRSRSRRSGHGSGSELLGTRAHRRARDPAIVACNHLSYLDPLTNAAAVMKAGRRPRFLAKDELFRIPVVGMAMRGAGQIPVRAGNGRRDGRARRGASGRSPAGEVVVIYPEGTVTTRADHLPMRGQDRHRAALARDGGADHAARELGVAGRLAEVRQGKPEVRTPGVDARRPTGRPVGAGDRRRRSARRFASATARADVGAHLDGRRAPGRLPGALVRRRVGSEP